MTWLCHRRRNQFLTGAGCGTKGRLRPNRSPGILRPRDHPCFGGAGGAGKWRTPCPASPDGPQGHWGWRPHAQHPRSQGQPRWCPAVRAGAVWKASRLLFIPPRRGSPAQRAHETFPRSHSRLASSSCKGPVSFEAAGQKPLVLARLLVIYSSNFPEKDLLE